jgi:transposase
MYEISTPSSSRFVGLDVHKATIAVAVAEDNDQPPEVWGTIPNDPAAVRKMVRKLSQSGHRLKAAYEAGPTGYDLYRQLTGLGAECMVAVPTLIPRPGGNGVKTDKRDAVLLARLLRRGDLTAVYVPDREQEALRALCRARYDAKEDHQRARQRLNKFLLQMGVRRPVGLKAWSRSYHQWLQEVQLDQPAAQVTFEDYRAAEQLAQERVRRLEQELRTWVQQDPQAALLVDALQALRGVGFLTAVTIVVEVGDFRRFPTARAFMAFVGLTPSEHSSGESRHRGGITHAGNRYLRHVLVQSAHHSRHQPNVSRERGRRLAEMPRELSELALKAQGRLHYRYRSLSRRIGRPKAIVATARELAGFVWDLGRQMEERGLRDR